MENIGIVQALGLSVLGMAVVFAMLVLLMAVIAVMGKALGTKKVSPAAPASPAPMPAAAQAVPAPAPAGGPTARGSCGPIDLHDVDERTAAMLMAIVADKMGAPLCELRFKSIRKVK